MTALAEGRRRDAPPGIEWSRPRASADTSDAALMRALAAAEPHALTVLYARHAATVRAAAKRILADARFAEDVTQEVFLALWRNPARFDPSRGALTQWLLAMAHHKAVDVVRHEEAMRRHQLRSSADTRPPMQGAARDETGALLTATVVRRALTRLTPAHREVLVLAYYGGYTQPEIAHRCQIPLGTVKTRSLHALRRLSAYLGTLD